MREHGDVVAFDAKLRELLNRGIDQPGPILILTGSGISAESGIPTFRGEEGYWTVGSTVYQPTELATREAFEAQPHDVWSWYLYRRSICHAAEPNDAHRALASLERALHHDVHLVTQNVDGLHLRAGSTLERMYQIHGNLDFMRHDDVGERTPILLPPEIELERVRGQTLSKIEVEALTHSSGVLGRPHVLWFDECYDEEIYHFESSLEVAMNASMVVVIGTSGATNLPVRVAMVAARRNIPLVVMNLHADSHFVEIAKMTESGWFEQGRAAELVPKMADYLIGRGPGPTRGRMA